MLAMHRANKILQLEDYAELSTKAEPILLQNLIQETKATMHASEMLTGRQEGRLLKLLVQMSKATSILEIGMYTGYSALSMAEALPTEGQLITCEINTEVQVLAEKYFAKSPHGHKITVCMGNAIDTIAKISKEIDFVFIDADKLNHDNYYEAVMPKLKPQGLIVLDNAFWGASVLDPQDQQSITLDKLNKKIAVDPRVENVLITVRDGINIVRKK
jgi:caffeoyl-CoA O-methyltransferase